MSDDSNNTIDLKKRARRRLVGAAALALLAIIVLPIVMDSEPKPAGQDIQIRIPSQDGETLAARVVPGNSIPVPLQHQQEKPSSIAPVTDAPPPIMLGESGEKPIEPGPVPKSVILPKPKAEAPAANEEPVKKSEANRAVAMLEGKDTEQWVVQIGAYRNPATVKQMSTKLKELGVSAYTEKAEVPPGATRVRAGPFSSREAAEKARLRIKTIGIDGKVAPKQ